MRYMITHSLLSSWLYLFKENPYESADSEDTRLEDFIKTLKREPSVTTEAMMKGIVFEDMVTRFIRQNEYEALRGDLSGFEYKSDYTPNISWENAAKTVATPLTYASLQYKAYKEISVSGLDIFLYGRLDALKAGVIYDIKYSGKYERGKFYESTQHPMYFELIPEAEEFTYLISDGTNVFTETYHREETRSIVPIISDFISWLTQMNLLDVFKEHWCAK